MGAGGQLKEACQKSCLRRRVDALSGTGTGKRTGRQTDTPDKRSLGFHYHRLLHEEDVQPMDGQTFVVPKGSCAVPHLSYLSAAYVFSHGPVVKLFPEGCERVGRRRLRKESHKPIRIGGVTCFYGKSHDSTKISESSSLDSGGGSEGSLATVTGRQGVGDFNGDKIQERYKVHNDGSDGGKGLHRNLGSQGKFVVKEKSWAGPEIRSGKVIENVAVSGASEGRNVQCIEEGGDENIEGRMLDRGTRSVDQGNELGGGDKRKSNVRQPVLNIPRSELMKIEELRFSGDLREGDSGPQVLNLQRALFWLGHLPGLLLTGYFGPETTRALQEFHTAHGVPTSGVWGFHSQQALRKHLQPESYRVNPVDKPTLKGPSRSSRTRLSHTSPLAKRISGKIVEGGQQARQAVRIWYSKALPDMIASISALPQMASVSGRVGIIVLSVVVVSSIAKLWFSMFRRPQGQPVRRRVMSWRNDASLRESTRKALRTPSIRSQGPLKSSESDEFMRRPRNRTQASSPNQHEDSNSLLDRLVLFDGQVLRGDGPQSSKTLPSMSSGLDILAQNDTDDTNRSSVWNRFSHTSQMEQPLQSGREVDQGKETFGLDRFVKLEADPPRKHNLLSRYEPSSRLTAKEAGRPLRESLYDSPNPSWSVWMGNFFSNISKGRSSSHKSGFRRTVRRGNSPVRTRTSERARTEGKPPLRFNKIEKGAMDDSDLGRRQEDDEADLRRRVEDLHRAVQAAEQTRMAAMRALAEERMRSLELEVKISRQKEAAISLEEEVRVLKESHDALLASLRKKYSSSAAARAAAALLYQNWDNSDSNARV
ncbi:hypothetical protein R1flu_018739 [Riccia fluitans]|uniref:Peptidoglycan binding-like domain-containing protein n=1 Tax=Riccia fluitans TaxID=41844 RepID=A0ABD1ZGP1_9MARC